MPICASSSRDSSSVAFRITNVMFMPCTRVNLSGFSSGKHELLRQAQAVAAVAVERLAADAAKVADAGQGQRNQPVHELVHLAAAERDLAADLHSFAQAEGRNGLAGDGDDRLLAVGSVEGKPIETLVGVSTDAAAIDKLKSVGITVASKTLKLDLGALLTELNDKGEFFGHDKIEGLATPDGGKTLVIANDSDFGLAGIDSETPPFKLKPKTLANGRPDTGEFVAVDTTKLPPQTRQRRCPSRWAEVLRERPQIATIARRVACRHGRSRRVSTALLDSSRSVEW